MIKTLSSILDSESHRSGTGLVVDCYETSVIPSIYHDCESILRESENSFSCRVIGMTNRMSQAQTLTGRWLVAHAFGIPLEELLCGDMITLSAYGKPKFSDTSKGWFSISHSGTRVIVAKSDYPIGVDIEQCHKAVPYIPYTVLTASEQVLVGPDYDAFLYMWVRKESVAKLVGTGLSMPLRFLDCSRNPIRFGGGALHGQSWVGEALSPEIFVYNFDRTDGEYIGALASYHHDVCLAYHFVDSRAIEVINKASFS